MERRLEDVERVLEGLAPQFSDLRTPPGLAASCPCSEDRVLRTLSLLPKSELAAIIAADDVVEAKCEFCGTVYRKTAAEVEAELAARDERDEREGY